jgi:E3 ubiquitin-protein ligase listerin
MKYAYRLLTLSHNILLVYLTHRGDVELCKQLWQNILEDIAEHPEEALATLNPLLRAAEQGTLPDDLRPQGDELDATVGQFLVTGLSGRSGGSETLELLKRVLLYHRKLSPSFLSRSDLTGITGYFITESCLRGIVSSVCATVAQHAQSCLRKADLDAPSLGNLLSLLDIVTKSSIFSLVQEELTSILPELFVVTNVLPAFHSAGESDAQHRVAGSIFLRCFAGLAEDSRDHVVAVIQQRLQDILLDCTIPIK